MKHQDTWQVLQIQLSNVKKCKSTFRADRLISETVNVVIPESAELEDFDKTISEKNVKCPKCKGEFENARKFNMMFKVGIGP